ncbi:hypothetical protein PENTCL1PPCAC_14206, partial [Pristionchus entomophagus]
YRRSRNRKYVCRSGTDQCAIGEGVNCRKCRLCELERKLEGKPIADLVRHSRCTLEKNELPVAREPRRDARRQCRYRVGRCLHNAAKKRRSSSD